MAYVWLEESETFFLVILLIYGADVIRCDFAINSHLSTQKENTYVLWRCRQYNVVINFRHFDSQWKTIQFTMHIARKIRIFLIEYYGFLLEPKHCCNVFVYICCVPRIPLQIWSGLNHFKITLARICTDIKNSIAIKTSKNTKHQMIFCPFVDKKN